jgi:hypothetical protein
MNYSDLPSRLLYKVERASNWTSLLLQRAPNTMDTLATPVHAHGTVFPYAFMACAYLSRTEPVSSHNLTPVRSVSYREVWYVDAF